MAAAATGTGLALFNTAMPTVPDEVNKFFQDNTNMTSRSAVPSLAYGGKIWSINLNGESTQLTKIVDGEAQPVQMMKVVVLDYAKRRGRAYYEGNYDPNKVSMPKCWSDDGNKPNAEVKEKQNPICETCPMAKKGSKMTDANKATTACSQHRMVAVVPSHDLSFTPLRLKIAITSDYDGQSPDHEAAGWFGFNNFTDMLRSKQVPHTAKLVTKIKFDPKVNYPKLLFSPDRWLTPDELTTIIPIVQSDEVKALLDGTYTVNGSDGVARDDALAPAADKPAEISGPSAEEIAAKEAEEAKAKAKAERQAKAKAAAEEAARLAKEAETEDEGEIILPGQTGGETAKVVNTAATTSTSATPPGAGGKPAANKPSSAPVTTSAAPGDVSDLLKDWGG